MSAGQEGRAHPVESARTLERRCLVSERNQATEGGQDQGQVDEKEQPPRAKAEKRGAQHRTERRPERPMADAVMPLASPSRLGPTLSRTMAAPLGRTAAPTRACADRRAISVQNDGAVATLVRGRERR